MVKATALSWEGAVLPEAMRQSSLTQARQAQVRGLHLYVLAST